MRAEVGVDIVGAFLVSRPLGDEDRRLRVADLRIDDLVDVLAPVVLDADLRGRGVTGAELPGRSREDGRPHLRVLGVLIEPEVDLRDVLRRRADFIVEGTPAELDAVVPA